MARREDQNLKRARATANTAATRGLRFATAGGGGGGWHSGRGHDAALREYRGWEASAQQKHPSAP